MMRRLSIATGVALAFSLLAAAPLGATVADKVSNPIAQPASAAFTTNESLPEPPKVSAPAWGVYDAVDDELLAGTGVETPRPIASLTKLMTALVVVEKTEGTEQVKVSKTATAGDDGAGIGLKAGQKHSVDTLLEAMLVYSANDAAVALAEYVSGSETDFIKEMNDRADELDLGHSTFTSVNGLDGNDPEKLTESTPADLVALTDVALKDPRIRTAVKLREVEVELPGSGAVTFQNRNPLLGTYRGVDGVKTGHTDAAGYCLLVHWRGDDTSATAGGSGNELYVIVMGEQSEDARARDARKLLDWGRQLRPRMTFAREGDRVGTAPVRWSTKPVELFASATVAANVRIGKHVRERYVLPRLLEPPLREGDEVGRYDVLVGDEVVASSKLYVYPGVRRPSRTERWKSHASRWRGAMGEGVRELRRQGRRFGEYWGLQ